MALYRQLYITFWSDPKVDDDFSPEDKYFYLYLLTNPHTSISGCYEISMKQCTRETGYTEDSVRKLLKRLSDVHGVIKYDPQTKEVLLLNWHKYNWSKSPNFIRGIKETLPYIKNREFKEYIISKLNNGQSGTVGDGRDTVGDAIPTSVYYTDTVYSYSSDSDIKDSNASIEDSVDSSTNGIDKKDRKRKGDIDRVVEEWNGVGLQKVVRLAPRSMRGKMLAERIEEYGVDSVIEAVHKAGESSYLKTQPWFAFDWFVRPNNFIKVLEGKYNRGNRTFMDL